LPKEALTYFQRFRSLVKYKKQIEEELSLSKKIGSEFGNFRYSFEDDANWALSHKIQSTASYIYKTALIRVYKEVKSASFLIPMHDGTVYQIDAIKYEVSKLLIEKIYIDEFKKVCPQIEPRISCSEIFQ
jgi:DNA polymerase I-like protein with 3'-5' exonuclease and polymerase domains